MKIAYIRPEITVIRMQSENLMQWFSTKVNPDQEIDDGDVGAKGGFFDDETEETSWEEAWK